MRTDDLQHFILGLAVAIVGGWQIAGPVCLTVEAVQVEEYYQRHGSLEGYWWDDTGQDIVMDAAGIIVGQIIHNKLKKKKKPALEPGGFIIFKGDTLVIRDNKLVKLKEVKK